MSERLYTFVGGGNGLWRVVSQRAIVGEPLAAVERLELLAGAPPLSSGSAWALRGVTSNERYVTRPEKTMLVAAQEGLGRPAATCAALIPIRKNAQWWGLTQDERRAIFEDASAHIQIGMKYLPAIARRLHHCRDLGTPEPFDFLTWFEFAPEAQSAFDELLAALRATEEWKYIDREVELRATRAG